jgi:steroid Delta-isomerase
MAFDHIIRYFETLTPQSLMRAHELYAQQVYFKDPFNEVQSLDAVQRIFMHMFESLHEPRFVVTSCVAQGGECFLVWEFKFRFKRFDTQTQQSIRGSSHLKLTADGKINYHRDYWDAAEELYEKLPLLRALMRWLKQRAAH